MNNLKRFKMVFDLNHAKDCQLFYVYLIKFIWSKNLEKNIKVFKIGMVLEDESGLKHFKTLLDRNFRVCPNNFLNNMLKPGMENFLTILLAKNVIHYETEANIKKNNQAPVLKIKYFICYIKQQNI